ncbi:MAG: MATE family efflux transporter, partial [Lachnospiraceae bacterium]|nr:MATE family efflux transporter [Lachnospiraceae bacterium]
ESLAAVTLAFPLTMLIGALSTGIGVGINSCISRNLGASKIDKASKAAANGMLLGLISVAIMILFGIFGTEAYLKLYTDDSAVISQGITYIRTISLLAFGQIFTQITFSILQGSGNMIIPMISQLVGGALVIILDPLFIFGFKLEILGAALASSLSQIVSMGVGLYGIFIKNKNNLHISINDYKPNGSIIKDILAVGIPAILTQATTSIVSGIISKMIAVYGTAAISVFGGFSRFSSLGVLPVFGITRGMSPILGYSVGSGNKKRFIDTQNLAMKAASVITCIVGLVFLIFPTLILNFISATPQMKEIGISAYRILSLSLFINGVAIVMAQSFPPAKKSYLTTIYTILRQVAIMIPLCLIGGKIWGITGVWIGYAATDYIALIVVIIMTVWFRKNVVNKLGNT